MRTSMDSRMIRSSSSVRRRPWRRTICDRDRNETAANEDSAICIKPSNGWRCCGSQSGHDTDVRFTHGTRNVNSTNTTHDSPTFSFVD